MSYTLSKPTERRRQLDEAFSRLEAALRAICNGNPNPYIALWEQSPDVTLYGAWGPVERGVDALRRTFEWVASRFTGGELVPEYDMVDMSGDLAYTVGFERGEVSVDGGPRAPMTIRVTHVYRYSDGAWRLVQRHADFPPRDQRAR
jgi:ketosteroid isomerase-like protein